jgi:hypothetical protein
MNPHVSSLTDVLNLFHTNNINNFDIVFNTSTQKKSSMAEFMTITKNNNTTNYTKTL